MNLICRLVLSGLAVSVAFGQLTLDQKTADFQQTAALYAKRYGPYEWKRDVIGFDLLNIAPWLTRITATKDDLDYYEVVSEYVSKLYDAHDGYELPSNFVATLNFSVDIYGLADCRLNQSPAPAGNRVPLPYRLPTGLDRRAGRRSDAARTLALRSRRESP